MFHFHDVYSMQKKYDYQNATVCTIILFLKVGRKIKRSVLLDIIWYNQLNIDRS